MPIQRKITQPYAHSIEISKSGLVAILISACCESKRLLSSKRDEDLRVEIDDLQFREIPPKKKVQLFNIPASWNGSKLRGLKKTIVFLINLQKGKHTISLIPKDSAFIEEIEVEELTDRQDLEFDIEEQAEDGDRRPWYTFVLVDLPSRTISASVTLQYRWWDSDDVKIIIDNKIQRQPKVKLHKFWFFAGILIKKLFKKLLGKRATLKHSFEVGLPQATHYIEFWADKTPILHEVELELGEIELEPVKEIKSKRTPTVDDPKWTGNLRDDPKEILLARVIYGEAGGVSKLAKIAVAWSVRNRVEDSRNRWNDNYHEVILQEKQYDSLWNEKTYQKVRILPLENKLEKKAWQDSYEIARNIIQGKIKDPTKGANHFYSVYIRRPNWAKKEKFTFSVDNFRFYKL